MASKHYKNVATRSSCSNTDQRCTNQLHVNISNTKKRLYLLPPISKECSDTSHTTDFTQLICLATCRARQKGQRLERASQKLPILIHSCAYAGDPNYASRHTKNLSLQYSNQRRSIKNSHKSLRALVVVVVGELQTCVPQRQRHEKPTTHNK